MSCDPPRRRPHPYPTRPAHREAASDRSAPMPEVSCDRRGIRCRLGGHWANLYRPGPADQAATRPTAVFGQGSALRASLQAAGRHLPATTYERAVRRRADSCLAVAEKSSDGPVPAQLLSVVLSHRLVAGCRGSRIQLDRRSVRRVSKGPEPVPCTKNRVGGGGISGRLVAPLPFRAAPTRAPFAGACRARRRRLARS
jgi:hypothetical protein